MHIFSYMYVCICICMCVYVCTCLSGYIERVMGGTRGNKG